MPYTFLFAKGIFLRGRVEQVVNFVKWIFLVSSKAELSNSKILIPYRCYYFNPFVVISLFRKLYELKKEFFRIAVLIYCIKNENKLPFLFGVILTKLLIIV